MRDVCEPPKPEDINDKEEWEVEEVLRERK